MKGERVTVAESGAFRRPGVIERMGDAVGRAVPDGALRRMMRGAYRRLLVRSIVSKLPGGEKVRISPDFRFVTWNPAEYEAFRASVGPGDVALDVGANVGAYALLLGQWVRPGGRVYAFEPAPEAFAGLTRHVEMNGLGEVVRPVQAAVSDHAGTADLVADGIQGTNRIASSGSGTPNRVLVQAVTLDEFCSQVGITPKFLKIDVEGAELAVLRGARETIARMGDKPAVFVEMHPTLWREMGIKKKDVIDELKAQGLRAEALGSSRGDPWRLEGECLRLVRA